MKRALDVVASAAGLVLLSPVLLAAALLVKLDSPGPVFFAQKRVGRDFRPFLILKFRTMRHGPAPGGSAITVGADPRITRVGRVLRRTKIDELPQLINVLRGEMSLVGPRPELEQYVSQFHEEYAGLLHMRPGITDPASIRFRNEAEILARAADPQQEYVTRVLPEKLRLSREYVRDPSVARDLAIIARTIFPRKPV